MVREFIFKDFEGFNAARILGTIIWIDLAAGPSVEGPPSCEGLVSSLYICPPFAMESYYNPDFPFFHILYPPEG